MEAGATTCSNCGAQIQGNFCSSCGQRSSVSVVTFKETFGDLAAGLLSLEAPIWKTIVHLTIKPGTMLTAYLAGKRKSYYKPVSFFIIMSALYLLVRWAIGFDLASDTTVRVGNIGDGQMLSKARAFFVLNVDKLLFFFVFSMALMLKLFFYKRYSLAEYFAVSFYMVGVYMLLQTLSITVITFIYNIDQWYAFVIMGFYFIVAMILLFKRPKFWVALKAYGVFMFSVSIYMTLSFGLSYLIVAINR